MTLTATTADTTVTATVEMAVPTNLGDLMVTTSNNAITEGRAAWIRIKTASKMMREDWRKVGEALLIGRRKFTNERGGLNKKGFGQWCRENGFDDMDRFRRADAMWLAENWSNVQSLHISLCHPTAIRSAYNDALNGTTPAEDEDDDTPSLPSPAPATTAAHSNPTPSISAPVPMKEEDEDDLPFDPSPDGKATFVQTSTSTPSPSPGNTPDVVGNDEEEEDVQRKRGRLYAADLITDPEQKTLHDLNAAQLRITGGADFGGTTAKSFISSYMGDLNPSTIFNDMQSDMSEALTKGSTLEEAREIAHQRMETFRAQMIEIVNRVCDDGAKLFQNRTAPMDKAVKFLPKAFHQSTPPAEALTAAIMAIKCMEA